MQLNKRLKSGDLVRVKSMKDIIKTLDSNQCLDNLPFMPEMKKYSGKVFKVQHRIEKTCVGKQEGESTMTTAEFINNDVVYLDGLRCDGDFHDNCQRSCMIFWKEAWLERVSSEKEAILNSDGFQFSTEIKNSDGKYFCQSTQLTMATKTITKSQILAKVFSDLNAGTFGILKALQLMIMPVIRKVIKKIIKDQHPRGKLEKTPDEKLNLQPGEIIEIKSLKEIIATLDKDGKNKGLIFEPDMREFCGKRFKVQSRLEKMILERNGKMVNVKNSVILDNITCNCFYAFGGCPRKELQYWREIWLKRVENN